MVSEVKAFPMTYSLGGQTMNIEADGTVTGDKDAFAAVLANAVQDEGKPMDPQTSVSLSICALALNAPWRKP